MCLTKQRVRARVFIILFLGLTCLRAFPQSETIHPGIRKVSFIYAVKDTNRLGLDVYSLDSIDGKRPCLIFVFGGAFVGGRRDDTLYNRYFNTLAEQGYVVVSISYRLGLKGVKKLSVFNVVH